MTSEDIIACGKWSFYRHRRSRRVFLCAELAYAQRLPHFDDHGKEVEFLGGDMVFDDEGQLVGLSVAEFEACWTPI